jgi:hypothetical protein
MTSKWGFICFGLVLGLMGTGSAAADTINNPAASQSHHDDDGLEDLPAAQLSGWFSGGFSDPSLPWTDPRNIAAMNRWASLVAQLQEHPELLGQFYGLGMTDPQTAELISGLNVASIGTSNTAQSIVPEPATLGSLGCALGMLGWYARKRTPQCHVTKT